MRTFTIDEAAEMICPQARLAALPADRKCLTMQCPVFEFICKESRWDDQQNHSEVEVFGCGLSRR